MDYTSETTAKLSVSSPQDSSPQAAVEVVAEPAVASETIPVQIELDSEPAPPLKSMEQPLPLTADKYQLDLLSEDVKIKTEKMVSVASEASPAQTFSAKLAEIIPKLAPSETEQVNDEEITFFSETLPAAINEMKLSEQTEALEVFETACKTALEIAVLDNPTDEALAQLEGVVLEIFRLAKIDVSQDQLERLTTCLIAAVPKTKLSDLPSSSREHPLSNEKGTRESKAVHGNSFTQLLSDKKRFLFGRIGRLMLRLAPIQIV